MTPAEEYRRRHLHIELEQIRARMHARWKDAREAGRESERVDYACIVDDIDRRIAAILKEAR
jgi:DNA invertase Pin-like site-specific DNA recombinase